MGTMRPRGRFVVASSPPHGREHRGHLRAQVSDGIVFSESHASAPGVPQGEQSLAVDES